MANLTFPLKKFKDIDTPFYYYNIDLLKKTLQVLKEEIKKYGFAQHYAVKANSNRRILEVIASSGLGADCVSGNEIREALLAGFPASKIVFAGVAKTDKEINFALDSNIFCFNVESIVELDIINQLAYKKGKYPQVALRINPNVDANTHKHITTGLSENKFGIDVEQIDAVLSKIKELSNIELIGIHFHIGSQITDIGAFGDLCERVNELQDLFEEKEIALKHINLGGGLGVNYEEPDKYAIPDFAQYFELFNKGLNIRPGQFVHFELGRAIVAQCGALIARVIYVKEGLSKKFAILDAGMTELIRPALYQAYHKIENLDSDLPEQKYDVVGPICESTDTFAQDYMLNEASRGDLIGIRTAGAYGEVMASRYNCRDLVKSYYSDKIQ